MTLARVTSLLACTLVLASCAALRDEADASTVSVRGVKPTLEQLNVGATTAAQNAFVNDLTAKAGIVDSAGMPLFLGPRNPDWAIVTEAGIYEIGRQCDQYLDMLFHYNRNQRALRQGLTASGAAAATIMGLAGVAAPPIAIVAAAVGLSASLFDANVNSVLFTIEPSALRNIALKGRQGYLARLKMSEISTRPRMLIALQGYLAQCSPAAIEANVNNAASGAPSVASTDLDTSQGAAVLAAPATVLVSTPATVLVSTPTREPVIMTPTPVATENLAANRGPGEEGVRRSELVRAQEALGVKADGDFGPATRQAITEFQRGANQQNPLDWTANDINGRFTGKTRSVLGVLAPLPATFQSPFERGLFGAAEAPSLGQRYAAPLPSSVNGFLVLFKPAIPQLPPGDTASDLAAKLVLMRKRLGEMTSRETAPLTSALYKQVSDAAADRFGPRQ